jgi:hypothetical protein
MIIFSYSKKLFYRKKISFIEYYKKPIKPFRLEYMINLKKNGLEKINEKYLYILH